MTLSQFDLIEIEWLDANLGYNYQGPADTAGELATMRRVGYFISRKRDPKSKMAYLVLASERVDTGEIREPMSVPEAWVTNITRLVPGKSYAKGSGPRRKK